MSNPQSNSHASNQVSNQLNKLRQIVFTRDTAITFRQSINLLGTVLKETLVLLWLGLCYALVAVGWLSDRAVTTGRSAKTWVETFQETNQNQSASEMASEASKTVVSAGKNAIDYVMTQAKKQVGLSE